MNEINFTSAQWMEDEEGNNIKVIAVIGGTTVNIPLDPENRHYAEILRQVEAGTLTIADAD